ncbi:DUF2782 domain-containing protein [Dyella jiangningensis]|uniref:DUF2782 domain-containing protein n=1 Tax=Dyella jiangningensis TaxID=1379159 RepID=A0A328P7X2_9GAMM|nr:DUF2782 domain-containing protein [Dyella jiangningensis]RAO76705.1 hypothetical protein CA260_01915 [Dyella jiangningensis]
MKSVTWLVVLGMAVASSVLAQSASQFPPAPPPPGINDPGVKAVAPPPPAPATKQSSPATSADTSATLSQPASSSPSSQPRDARGEAPPQVSVHTEGDQTIQEYRRSGQLYMVVVTSRAGITQTYMVDQKGAWTNQAGEPVKPVMYKVMEWGKSKSAEDQDNGGK